jgi:S1-C subfamily serine protease
MAPYVYDFGVEENSSAIVATAAAPKEVQATPADNLVAQGSQFSSGGWLGVATDLNRSARHDGVPLSEVCAGGPADQAGIQPGDTILSIANRYLYTVDQLWAAIKQLEPASRVAVRYQRRAVIVDTYVIVGQQSSASVSQYPL